MPTLTTANLNFPLTAVIGQQAIKTALLLAAVAHFPGWAEWRST